MTTATNQNATTANAITLNKVAADYKLQAGEAFLLQGRINKAQPAKPYYHVTRTAADLAATLPADLNSIRAAISKLWGMATVELLKDKAAALTPGATATISLTTTDILLYIADIGSNRREAISGEELDEFCASDSFTALAAVHNWSPVAVAKVSTALRQYAAPAHRKNPADAKVLSLRLATFPELLTGEDSEEDAKLTTIFNWLMVKLTRDVEQQVTNLADAI